jgi:predicted dithiol-disulfide oxidoreductase (DUF899 family)
MNAPRVVSRDEWLVARKELLTAEREAAEERMALAAERAALPAVEIDKEYLFEGRRRLIVDHLMFDFDFNVHVTLDEAVAPIEYDYRDRATLEADGEPYYTAGEQGGLSVFLRDGQTVYHTYSTYADGTDLLHGTLMYLDPTPLGRHDDGELRHHDRYGH